MLVYLHSERAKERSSYVVTVAPAADTAHITSEDVPAHWKDADGKPRQIEIIFEWGKAEVPDDIGRYMVARGIAHRSGLVRAARAVVGLDN